MSKACLGWKHMKLESKNLSLKSKSMQSANLDFNSSKRKELRPRWLSIISSYILYEGGSEMSDILRLLTFSGDSKLSRLKLTGFISIA